MSFYVALESWRDDDGDLIEAGVSHVADTSDAFKRHPHRFKRVDARKWNDVFFGRRLSSRIYGVGLSYSNEAAGFARTARPAWQLSDYDADYDEPWRLRRLR